MNILGITVLILSVTGLTNGAIKSCKVIGAKTFKVQEWFGVGSPLNNGAINFPPAGHLVTLFETANNDCYMKVMAKTDANRPDGCNKLNFPDGCNYITGMTVEIGDVSNKHKVEVVLEGNTMSLKVNGEDEELETQYVNGVAPEIKISKWGTTEKPQIHISRTDASCSFQSAKLQYNWNQIMIKDDDAENRARFVSGACGSS